MTVREIQGFLAEQYGTEVSPEFISSVTDAVMAEVGAWQARPLEPMYPVIFFDALRLKIREEAVVRNKAIYLALGVLPDGTRDIPSNLHPSASTGGRLAIESGEALHRSSRHHATQGDGIDSLRVGNPMGPIRRSIAANSRKHPEPP
jgi:hypothetical protein